LRLDMIFAAHFSTTAALIHYFTLKFHFTCTCMLREICGSRSYDSVSI
jgi:hypothetical protein